MLAWGADALVVIGVMVMTIGVIGIYRMPDVYMQLHAASKSVVFGVIALLAASAATRDASVIARAALIAAFLVVTTPVAAHAIGWAARGRGEPMRSPGAVDEADGRGGDLDRPRGR